MIHLSYLRWLTIAVLLLALRPSYTGAWGFVSHRQVNEQAIRSMPDAAAPFFRSYADTIVAWSVKPDLRRSFDTTEGPKHFMDIDRYGARPFAGLPRVRAEAERKFGRRTVDTNGTLPWVIAELTDSLADAMRRRNGHSIVRIAADLSHYVADAHVPLHATSNYDGQLTGQKGLHARWESRLPERFGRTFKLTPQTVRSIPDPLSEAFRIILEGESLVDSILVADRGAREGIPVDQLTRKRERRGRVEEEYAPEYFERFHERLNGMVERRLQASIGAVASFWTAAWERAGRPDLTKVDVVW
jgi:hypothetical protein